MSNFKKFQNKNFKLKDILEERKTIKSLKNFYLNLFNYVKVFI